MNPELLLASRLRVKKERETVSVSEKLMNLDQAKDFVKTAHENGKTVVLVEGAWDLTHSGHMQHIRQASTHGDIVLLRLASAEYTTLYKGKDRPVEPFRTLVVGEIEHVDGVFVDHTAIPPDAIVANAHVLAALNPDVIALETEDDKLPLKLASARYAHDHLGSSIQPVVFTLEQYNSTTSIIKKIKQMA